jgi:hypothetical protein
LFEDIPQCLVRFLRLQLNRVQFLDDIRNGPVGFGVTGVDVTARGDVVVIFLQLGMIDNAAEFVLFLPADKGIGDALYAFIRNEVLGVALCENLAGINEKDLVLSSLGLGPG